MQLGSGLPVKHATRFTGVATKIPGVYGEDSSGFEKRYAWASSVRTYNHAPGANDVKYNQAVHQMVTWWMAVHKNGPTKTVGPLY